VTGSTGSAGVTGATGPTATVNIVFPGPSSSSGGGGFNFTFNTTGISGTGGIPYVITGTGNQYIVFADACGGSATYANYLKLPSATTANQVISLQSACDNSADSWLGATVEAGIGDTITDAAAQISGATSDPIQAGAIFVSDGIHHWYSLIANH
jgi:hypothetical protein